MLNAADEELVDKSLLTKLYISALGSFYVF